MPCIAIVGGGISGLATAYELTRRGHTDFVLYEASSRLGGIVETIRRDGFILECGPDSWVTEKPWASKLAVELGLEAEILPSNDSHRRTYILEDDQLIPMPDGMRMMVPTDLEAIATSPLFSESARQAYLQEPSRAEALKAFAAARLPDKEESIASFVERHFGGEVVEKIAGPLLAGVFGGDIRRLSATAVMAPFVQMEREHGSLILALQEKLRSEAKRSVFTTLKSGLQTLVEGMAATVRPSSVRLREPVFSVNREFGAWQVTTPGGIVSFDKIVIATPVHITQKLLAPSVPEIDALLEVEATSAVVAAFAFDCSASEKLDVPEGFGFLVPQRDQLTEKTDPQLLACTFVDQKFADRVPAGCTLFRAFFGGHSAATLLDRSDEFILDLARRHLSRVLGKLPHPAIAIVRRWPFSLPQYNVGHAARIARAEAIAAEIPGLHLIGNAFHGVGLPDLIHRARFLAQSILD